MGSDPGSGCRKSRSSSFSTQILGITADFMSGHDVRENSRSLCADPGSLPIFPWIFCPSNQECAAHISRYVQKSLWKRGRRWNRGKGSKRFQENLEDLGLFFLFHHFFSPPSSFGGKAVKSKFNSMPGGCRWIWIFGFGPRDFWEFPKSPQIPFIPRSFPDIPLASKTPDGVQEFPGG